MIDENIKAFLLYGKGIPIDPKQCLKNLFLALFFALPIILLGNILLKVCAIGILLVYATTSIYCIKNIKTKGTVFLVWGSMSLVFGLILFIDAVVFMALIMPKEKSIFVTAGLVFLYMAAAYLYLLYIKYLIHKGVYKDENKATGGTFKGLFLMMGVLGIAMASQLSKGTGQKEAVIVVVSCCILVSMMSMLGSPNLLKYYFIRKYNITKIS